MLADPYPRVKPDILHINWSFLALKWTLTDQFYE